jgi:3D (Asp-Asp-Asp) domain-containing protein/peptidoglycan hydrolase CwlO-like protein
VVGSPLVRGPGRGLRALGAVVLCGVAVGASLAAGGGAQTPDELEAQADALRAHNESLAAGSQSALASLTEIESRLAQARSELASFRARSAKVGSQRRAVSEQLSITRSAVRLTRTALATRLQHLYEEGNPDVLAVILGAGSLDEALSSVETLDLAARQDEELVQHARGAAARLTRLSKSLAAKQRELDQLAAVKAAATASLVSARSERLQAIAAFRATRSANLDRIAQLGEKARTLASAQAAPSTPVVTPGAPSLPAGPASAGVRSLTVVATGYALPGHTASGRAVGWGVVAVDPSVIPMGSRIAIPGYGMGVAADTGGAIAGARIDLWFPSVAQARDWGSRTVTVTVYPN